MSLAPPPPEWFRTRDDSYTRKLDPEGWCIALFDRLSFDPIPDSRTFFVSGPTDPWEAHRKTYGSKQALFDAYLARTQHPPERFASGTEMAALREVLARDDAGNALDDPATALVAVELGASEGTIISQFTEWLVERKKAYPAPSFVLPGNPTPQSKKLTRRRLLSWHDQRILQLYDLLFWRKAFDLELSDASIGSLMLHGPAIRNSDPLDKYRYSLTKLKEAVTLVGPLLFEQRPWGKK